MSEKKITVEECSVIDKMMRLKDEISHHAYEVDTMVKLGEASAMEETKPDIEWSMVFAIIGHILKMAREKIDELDVLLTKQRISELEAQPITAGLKRLDVLK